MNEAEFESMVGKAPTQDDMERANCVKAGQPGHFYCGICSVHNFPMWMHASYCTETKCVSWMELNRIRIGGCPGDEAEGSF